MRELLHISFGGIQYGILKDEILSVRDIHALHRVPLSPACIAGIMIDDGQAVTLADLSVCIGYEHSPAIEQGCILLMSEGEKAAGFVVDGEIHTRPVDRESIFPLPDYLKTPVADTCAVYDGTAIPIINIAELYSRVMKSGEEPSDVSLRVSAAQPQDISGTASIKFFSVAGEVYAVPAAGMDDRPVKSGQVTPLPNTPRHVTGVTFRDGRLLTVIDLTQLIKRQSGAPDSMMLIAGMADGTFGFLIDRDEGTLSSDRVAIKQLPLIAQSLWLRDVVVRAGELIPLVDLAMALSSLSGNGDEKPLWQRYAADSRFPALFHKQDVEVVEFSLLGVRYALPKMEVEDVIAFKPCRVLPDVLPIVVGVAEHNGEILPVVDLAMMFGRRSLTTPAWRMMLVSNGDFRALVITDAVFGERQLPLDMHRAVPIHLPHNLMYGCYPDEKTVTIILNTEAISVHFEKSLVQKFLPALSHEMGISPTAAVYTFPEEKSGEESQLLATATQARVEEAASAPAVVPAAGYPSSVPGFEQQTDEKDAKYIEREEPDTVVAAASSTGIPESPAAVDEWSAGAVIEQEPVENVPEQTTAQETMTAAAEMPEQTAPVWDIPGREPSGEVNKARELEAVGAQSPLEVLRASTKNRREQNESATATADSRPSEPIHTTANARSGEPYRLNREANQPETSSGHDEQSDMARKRKIVYATLAAILAILLFYVAGTSDKPAVGISVQGTEPAVKILQASVQPEQSRVETVPDKNKVEQVKTEAPQATAKEEGERKTSAQAGVTARAKQKAKAKVQETMILSPLTDERSEAPRSAGKPRASLELVIPANRPVDIDVYVVKKGDTLWNISKRLTGNALSYPRIAGKNKIADPALIFPGQKIRLIK